MTFYGSKGKDYIKVDSNTVTEGSQMSIGSKETKRHREDTLNRVL